MAGRVGYCRPVKNSHKGFCLATLENLTKEFPGESHLVLKITLRVSGDTPLMTIGYKYNSRIVLGFIAVERDLINDTGDPYLSCFPDIFLMFLFAPLFVLTF